MPLGGELLQQLRVLEPDAALVVPGEEVVQHQARFQGDAEDLAFREVEDR